MRTIILLAILIVSPSFLSLIVLEPLDVAWNPFPRVEAQRVNEPLLPILTNDLKHRNFTQSVLGNLTKHSLSLRANQDGSVQLFRNDVLDFSIGSLSALAGSTSILSNSSHTIVRLSSGTFFVEQRWISIARGFKLWICWNLPFAINLVIPFSRTFSVDRQSIIFGKLRFNFADAVGSGFTVVFDSSNNRVTITLQPSGCLDPVVDSSVATDLSGGNLPRDSVAPFGNDWWVVYREGTLMARACATAGGAFAITTWGAFSSENSNRSSGFFFNSTHIINVRGVPNIVRDSIALSASCGGAITSFSQALTSIRSFQDITQNATGWHFAASNDAASAQALTYGVQHRRADPYAGGLSTTGMGFVNNTISCLGTGGCPEYMAFNITAGRILFVGSKSVNGLRSRIFYTSGNQSFGTNTSITSNALDSTTSWSCLQGASGSSLARCIWLTSAGVLNSATFDGSSWSAATIIAYPGDVNTMIGITKANGDGRIAVLRRVGANIQWNRTNTAGTFTDTGSFFIGAQTASDYMAVSTRPNATGYVGIAWRNATASPFNIYFQVQQLFPTTQVLLTVNVRAFDQTTAINFQSPTVRVETTNGTVTSYLACSSSCAFQVVPDTQVRLAGQWAGGGVKVNQTNTVNTTLSAAATRVLIFNVFSSGSLRLYHNDGTLRNPTNVTLTVGHNSSVVTKTGTFTGGTHSLGWYGGGNTSSTMSRVMVANGNRIANATATFNFTANTQARSFRQRMYLITVQGVTPDGQANTWASWSLNATLHNQTAVARIDAGASGAITLAYLGNGSNTFTAWWQSLIVNNTFTYSATTDETLNFRIQVLRDVNGYFEFGRNRTTLANMNFSTSTNILRFNASGVTGEQNLRIRLLQSLYSARPETRTINNSALVTSPGSLSGMLFSDAFSAGSSGPTLVAYQFSQTPAGGGGGGGGGGGDAPAPEPAPLQPPPIAGPIAAPTPPSTFPIILIGGAVAFIAGIILIPTRRKKRERRVERRQVRPGTRRL